MHTTGLFLAILIGISTSGMQTPQPATPTPAKPAPQTPAKPVPQAPDQSAPQPPAPAPRRPAAARSGSVSFAVRVSDPARQPIAGVKVWSRVRHNGRRPLKGDASHREPASRRLFVPVRARRLHYARTAAYGAQRRANRCQCHADPGARTASPAGAGAGRASRAATARRQRRAGHGRFSGLHLEELRRPRIPEESRHWRAAGCRPRR